MATKARQDLIDDAIKAGYAVDHEPSGITRITKRIGTTKRGSSKRRGLLIHEDGTAIDISMGVLSLDAAKGLRSYKSMRDVLKLPYRKV